MTTARDLCTDALDEAGILGVGQTALASDINKVFTRLQRMVATWQKNRWLVPSLETHSFTLSNQKSYTVGLGGDINIIPPSQIKGGYIRQLNTGQTPVSLPLSPIFSYEDYIRITLKDLRSLPYRYFYDNKYPLANLFIWPVGNSTYEATILYQSQIGFGSTIASGEITDGGSGYTDGSYEAIELTGAISGTGATADITVTGGVITLVELAEGGQDFAIGEELTITDPALGAGTGFLWEVTNITSDLDTEINLPQEYEEALMYNLTLRTCSLYQIEPMPQTAKLARAGLNNIRKNNTQVPQLVMPVAPGVRTGKAFNLWNPDGY